jgi:hypothetical protein
MIHPNSLLKKSEKHPNPSFRRKPDKIAGGDFGQPKAGPKGGIQGCIPQSSILLILSGSNILDPGPRLTTCRGRFRRGDETFFSKLLNEAVIPAQAGIQNSIS